MDGQQIIIGFLVSFLASVLCTGLFGPKFGKVVRRFVGYLRRISPSPSWLPASTMVFNCLLLACLWMAVDDANMAMLLTGPFVLANLSGFLAGFAYRMSELRDYLVRQALLATTEAEVNKLGREAPTRLAVRFRAVSSGVCFFISAVTALMLIAVESSQQTVKMMTIALMILASSMATGNIASFIEPSPNRNHRDLVAS